MIALTVDVEEGFHGLWPGAQGVVKHHELPRGAFVRPLRSILSLFERYHVNSTFFVLGEIAQAFPEVVEEIHSLGHEVASHGYFHVDLTKIPLGTFEETEWKSRDVLTRVTGEVPVGFRAPFARINPAMISLVSKLGYVYDCSVVPAVRIPGWWSDYGASLKPHRVDAERGFFEVPIAVFPYLRLPISGWFLRNFGLNYVKTAIKWFLHRGLPVVIYVHPFDVDPYVQKLGGVRFHVTRHCGEYTLEAIRNLLEVFDCPKMRVRDILNSVTV